MPYTFLEGRFLFVLFWQGNAHLPHQEAGVHVLRHTFPQLVGEGQFIVLDVSFETIIPDFVGELFDETAQQEVVGGDDAVGLQSHELADQFEGAFLLVDGIGTFQNLVQDDEELLSLVQQVDDAFQPFQLGEEIRFVVGQRVGRAEAGHQLVRIEDQLFTAYGCADAGQQVVDSNGTQVSALSGHVGTGNDEEERARRKGGVVFHTLGRRHERVSHPGSQEAERFLGQFRIGVVGMIVGKGAQRAEGIQFPDGFQPAGDVLSVAGFPAFDADNFLQLEEDAAL